MHNKAYGKMSLVFIILMSVISVVFILFPAKAEASNYIHIEKIYEGNAENHLKVTCAAFGNSIYEIKIYRNSSNIYALSGGWGDDVSSAEPIDITDIGPANETKVYKVYYTVTTFYFEDEDGDGFKEKKVYNDPVTYDDQLEIAAGSVKGTIRSGKNVAWSGGNYVMTGGLGVEKGASLTINPSAIVSPNSNTIYVKGKLDIDGGVFDSTCTIEAFHPGNPEGYDSSEFSMTNATVTGSLDITAANKVEFWGNNFSGSTSASHFTFINVNNGNDFQIYNNEIPKGSLNIFSYHGNIDIQENVFNRINIGGEYFNTFYGSGAEGIYIANNEIGGDINVYGDEELEAVNVVLEGNTCNNPIGHDTKINFYDVNNVQIAGNEIPYGIVSIFSYNGSIKIDDNKFKSIGIGGEYKGEFHGCGAEEIDISNNEISWGIGISGSSKWAFNHINNVKINGNTLTYAGMGIYACNGYIDIRDNEIKGAIDIGTTVEGNYYGPVGAGGIDIVANTLTNSIAIHSTGETPANDVAITSNIAGGIRASNVNNIQIFTNDFQTGSLIIFSCTGNVQIEENKFGGIYMGILYAGQFLGGIQAEAVYIGNNTLTSGTEGIEIDNVGESNQSFIIEKNTFPESYPTWSPGGRIKLLSFAYPETPEVERIVRNNTGVAGIYLGDPENPHFCNASHFLIEGNEIKTHKQSDGIVVGSGLHNIIRDNALTFTDTSYWSLYPYGIALGKRVNNSYSDPETVSYNIVEGNTIDGFNIGIGILYCQNNIITGNQVEASRGANVWIGPDYVKTEDRPWEHTVHNRVFNNYFKQLEQDKINVLFSPYLSPESLNTNSLYGIIPDGTDVFGVSRRLAGNYYSDYDGDDYDRDGLGDSFHKIISYPYPGAPSMVDPYPLMPPGVILSNTRDGDFKALNKQERFNVAPSEKEYVNVLHFSLELPERAGESAIVTSMEFFYNTASDPDYWSMSEEEETEDLLGRLEALIGQSELPPAEYMKYLIYNSLGYLPGSGEMNEYLSSEEMNAMQQQFEAYTVQYIETKEGYLDKINNYELSPAEYGKYLILKAGSPLDDTEMQKIDTVLTAYSLAYDEKYQGNPPDPGNDKIITGLDGFDAVNPSCIDNVRLLKDLGGNQTELVATGDGDYIMAFANLNEELMQGQKINYILQYEIDKTDPSKALFGASISARDIEAQTETTAARLTVSGQTGDTTVRNSTIRNGSRLSVAVSPAGGGTVVIDPLMDEYAFGEQLTFQMNPSEGFKFDRLAASGSGNSMNLDENQIYVNWFEDETMNITAFFIEDPDANGHNGENTEPDISADSVTVGFGDVTAGSAAEQVVTVKNEGGSNLDIGQVSAPQEPFSIVEDNVSNQTLTPGAEATLIVRFVPAAEGIFNASFDIPSNDPDENPLTVNMSGSSGFPVWSEGSSLTASNVTRTDVHLSWTEATDNVAVTGYRIFKEGNLLDTVSGAVCQYDVTGLDPGMTYSFQVQAGNEAGNWTVNGLQANVTTLSEALDECFIATAAFGSKLEPSVAVLRQFRDQILLTNAPGKVFVEFYYRNSPPIAEFISGNKQLKAVVRMLLLPFIAIAYGFIHPADMNIVILSILWTFILIRRYRRQRI